MKASSGGSFPRACNSSAKTRKMRSSLPSRTECWKGRWQVWYGGYFLGSSHHCAPVPKTHKSRRGPLVCPARGDPAIEASFGSQDWFDQLPLGIAEFPSSSHAFLLPVFLHAKNS